MNFLKPQGPWRLLIPERPARRLSFSWLEDLALPLSTSVMETLPLSLALNLLFPLRSLLLIGAALGLFWWARAVEWLSGSKASRRGWTVAQVAGWLLTVALLLALQIAQAFAQRQPLMPAMFAVLPGLLTWLWRRALIRARLGFEHEALLRSFRLSLGLLLALLLLGLVMPATGLLAALSGALPLFAFCGLLSLSLTRLSAIRLRRHHESAGRDADPTRSWLLALSLLSLILIGSAFLLNLLFPLSSFRALLQLLTPPWNALWTAITEAFIWIIVLVLTPFFDLFALLMRLLPHSQRAAPPLVSPATLRQHLQTQGTVSLPPPLLITLRILLVLLALAALIWLIILIRSTVRRWQAPTDQNFVEEERQGLNPLAALGERWQRRRRRRRANSQEPEPPDLTPLRRLYRAWLVLLAALHPRAGRQPAETPAEYAARLQRVLYSGEESWRTLLSKQEAEELAAFIEQLTRAYLVERYGARPIPPAEQARLAAWSHRCTQHLQPDHARPTREQQNQS
jgi:hypothetical protein